MEIKSLQEIEKLLGEIEKEKKEADWLYEYETILKQYHGADEVISFQQAQKLNEEKESGFCVKSKIPRLDFFIDGFREGNLIIITSPTGNGKTTFAQTLTRNFSDNNIKSLWFSYEVPIKQFLAKYGDNIPTGFLPKNLISNKIIWLERKIVEAIVKYETKVVFIDHLHYLFELSGRNNASLEIGSLVREIKKIAIKYNVIIFLITHLTKTKFDARIGLEDIRDSSFISQEADFVIILWRTTKYQTLRDIRENGVIYKDEAVLSIGKNRFNGKLGSLNLILKDGLFEELSQEYGE